MPGAERWACDAWAPNTDRATRAQGLQLTGTSYVILGLLEQIGPATPYDLKRTASVSMLNFWSVPHTQLYAECARLASLEALLERREQSGRRRRVYRLTDLGREALARWRSEPTGELDEVRDVSVLKLFFGADPPRLAITQLDAHRQHLRRCERLREHLAAGGTDAPRGWQLTLEALIGHEREFIRFWSRIADRPSVRG